MTVDHVHVNRPDRTPKTRWLAVFLLATLSCQAARAQTESPSGQPTPIPPGQAQRVDRILEGLSDPNSAPPGQTLRDLGVPTEQLTMEDALRRALTNHPDLRTALANIESQEFGVTAATAARYPSFSFSASAGQSGTSGQLGGTALNRTGIQRSYGLGIDLNQNLLDFGRTRYRVQLAEIELATTRLAYINARQIVINNVVQAYFELLRQASAIEVGLANVQNAQLVVNQAQGFLEAGTRAKIELIRAEAALANAQLLVVQAQGGYGRAVAALASALGENELPNELPEPVALDLPPWDVDTVRQLARKGRPDLIIASLRVAQADARIKAARAEYYPQISLGAGYNWNDGVFPPLNTAYNVGINLSVPIINEPALSSAVGQAIADKKAAVATLESTELTVVQDATEALYTLREASGSLVAAGEGLRAAEETFRLATERNRVGVGNSLEVSQAQSDLVQARSLELQARYNVQTSIGNLLRATGQLDSAAVLPADMRLDPIFDLPQEVLPESERGKPQSQPVSEPEAVEQHYPDGPDSVPTSSDEAVKNPATEPNGTDPLLPESTPNR